MSSPYPCPCVLVIVDNRALDLEAIVFFYEQKCEGHRGTNTYIIQNKVAVCCYLFVEMGFGRFFNYLDWTSGQLFLLSYVGEVKRYFTLPLCNSNLFYPVYKCHHIKPNFPCGDGLSTIVYICHHPIAC